MCLYSRLAAYTCFSAILFIGGPGSLARPTPAAPAQSLRWQLHSYDGHQAPAWLRSPADGLLPELRNTATGVPLQHLQRPQAGACQPTLLRRLLRSAHLIPTLLGANDATVQNELRYLHLLEQLDSYEISGHHLRLYDATRPAPRLVFVLAQAPAR